MAIILIIGILILPWVMLPINGLADGVRMPKYAFLDYIAMAIICFSIIKGVKFIYRNKYLGWLCIWTFITIHFNWYLPLMMSFDNTQIYNISTIQQTIHFILILFMAYCCLSNLTYDDFLLIGKYICLSSVLVTIFGICQVIGFDPMKNIIKYKSYEQNHFSALVDHPNTIGNLISLSLPFFFFYIKQNKYKLGFLIVIFGLYCSHSTMSIASAVVATIIYLMLRFRQRIIFLLLTMIGFGYFCLSNHHFNKIDNGFSNRTGAWRIAIEHIKDNPLFGQGLGAFGKFNVMSGNMSWVFAHNDWLEMACSIGFFGCFLFGMVVLHSLRNFNFSSNNKLGFSYLCSFIVFLILMFGSFPMETPTSVLIGLIGYFGVEKIT